MVDSVCIFRNSLTVFLLSSKLNSYHPNRDDQVIAVKGAELIGHAEDCTGAELKR